MRIFKADASTVVLWLGILVASGLLFPFGMIAMIDYNDNMRRCELKLSDCVDNWPSIFKGD